MGVLRRGRSRAGSVETRVREALASLRPMLPLDGGELELISYEETTGLLVLRLEGACPDCEMPAEALLRGIESHLQQRIPEIREVRTIARAARDG